MIFIPMAVLITSCVILMKAIPEGAQRKKILRIMLVIIIMFITCHSPKVNMFFDCYLKDLKRPPKLEILNCIDFRRRY